MRTYSALSILIGFLLLSCGTAESPGSKDPDVNSVGEIIRIDPAMDAIAPADARIEKLADGFGFTEGPVWMPGGYLLFSDIPENVIRKWTPDGGVSVFLENAGYDKDDANEGAFIGTNGLTLDPGGRLILCEHGSGRVTRLETDGTRTVLADKWDGKRLNSPNDAVYRSDGTLYFTDPPYGLPRPEMQELDFMGVYMVNDGKIELLTKELTRPNGLAFSPDENTLYVANSNAAKKIWMKYDVSADGQLSNGAVFYDVTGEPGSGSPDGMKVDRNGNVYGTGPGGIWVFSPDGKHLGTICPPETPANLHWGDADGKTLYITARTGLYKIKLDVAGIRP